MSFLPQLRDSLSRSAFPSVARRTLTSTSPLRTATGYGDPEDEKPKAETPGEGSTSAQPPSGAESKAPKGQGGPVKNEGGKEDHGARDAGEHGRETQLKETKKIGEEPKKTEEGGAGPIGG